MLQPLSRLLGDRILSLRHGGTIACISDLIIDPRNLQILGLAVEGSTVAEAEPVIDTSDIREFSQHGLIIDSEDNIHELADIVRLQKIADEDFELFATKVYLDNGTRIGKVIDATFDPNSFYIHQLVVQPTLLRALLHSTTIVNRSQIVSINPKGIVVKQPTIKDESETAPAHVRPIPAK